VTNIVINIVTIMDNLHCTNLIYSYE